jgi:hypothetical protein
VADNGDKQLFMVLTNPVDGRDDEYNQWYDNVHLADVQRVPGVVGAQRYELVPTGSEGAPPPTHRYLAIYEIDRKANEVLSELMARAGGPQMPLSPALDLTTINMTVWKPRD